MTFQYACAFSLGNYSMSVKLAALGDFQCGRRDDSKILNEFRQYCNVSSSKKRLNPLIQATLESYRLFFIWRLTPLRAKELDFWLTLPEEGRWCGDAGEVMTFFFGDRPRCGLHYRDRCPEKWWSPNRKPSCGPGHDCQHAMLLPEAHEFETPEL